MTYEFVHNRFRLNGNHYTKKDLVDIAVELVKEGSAYQKQLGLFFLDWFDQSPEITLKTSGTTSKPKEILVQKQAMVNSALATGEFFELLPGDHSLCCLPVNFIAGKMMMVRALVLGLELEFVEPSARPLEQSTKNYHFVALTPMQVEESIDQLNRINKIIIGGSQVNPNLQKKLKGIPSEIYETYASTETLTHIAARNILEPNFKLLPGVSIHTDNRGCLVIKAPRISDQEIVTNDLVDLKSDTEFTWIGRLDNVVNSGGIKLFPEVIESKLQQKIPHRFFVGGIPNQKLGEKLVLVIEAAPYELDKNLFDALDKYEMPKQVFFRDEFLETESGKIKRLEILKSLPL